MDVLQHALQPIRWIDQALIAHYGIFEFSTDPDCLLRVSLTPSPWDVTLADGTKIAKGQVVAEFHLWSERTAAIFRDGSGLRPGNELRRRMKRSFTAFADLAATDARFATIPAALVRTSACEQFPRETVAMFASRWGFEFDDRPRSLGERFADFWDNVYIALLGLAYPSGSPQRALRRRLERLRIWISREQLLARHRSPATVGA